MTNEVKFDNQLSSRLDLNSARSRANREALLALLGAVRTEEDSIRQGGGAKAA